MKKLTALILTALLLVFSTAFAAKPGASAPPLKALWTGTECAGFILVDTRTSFSRYQNALQIYNGSSFQQLSETFATEAEATDALILFFIRMSDLDMTLADVPVDGTGAYDCRAWNKQLIGY